MEDMSLFKLAAEGLFVVRDRCPVDTGNLRDNGIQFAKTGENEFTISIGGSNAPYAVYTNEKWMSPRWRGKPNPNEHWIDNAVEDVVDMICERTGGKLSRFTGVEDRLHNTKYWTSKAGIERLRSYYT